MHSSSTALLVIDAQESFRHRDYWRADDVQSFTANLQALVDGAVARSVPVVQIFHVEETGPFSLAAGFVKTFEPLAIRPDAVFHKRRHSALVGSGLDVWLVSHGIRRVIVSGIRTEQCCETTTRHASDLGFAVDFVTDATLTFPMADAAGRKWSAAEIKAATELVLTERFARIATVEQALGVQSAGMAA